MSHGTAAQLAVEAFVEYLLAALPAAVVTKNLGRAATLTTSVPGPWIIPVDGAISVTLDGVTYVPVTLTPGSNTATQLATAVNTAMGATVGSATADGRFRLTSTTTPTGSSTNSAIGIGADETGANVALGFDPSGFKVVRAPLIAPTHQGILDGEPSVLPPLANGRMVVVIRDREDAERQLRRDEREVTMEVLVYVPLATQDESREEIQSACACIVNVCRTTSGRQFAKSTANEIGFTQVKSVKVSGSRWGVKNDLSFMMDIARLVVTARVYQLAVL